MNQTIYYKKIGLITGSFEAAVVVKRVKACGDTLGKHFNGEVTNLVVVVVGVVLVVLGGSVLTHL